MSDHFIDIAKNAKILDELKTDLLGTVATLFRAIIQGAQGKIIESLAAIIILAYIIGRRLGVKFFQLDQAVKDQLKRAEDSEHEVEKWFNDLSSLKQYIDDVK